MNYKGEIRNLTARERRIRNRYLGLFVTALLLFIWISVMYLNATSERNEYKSKVTILNKTVDSLSKGIDTLVSNNFSLSTEAGRYEITLEYLKEVDSIAYKKFKKFLDHETE